ncbi:unnamed protein product [Ectocarpus sp. 12 AP-2014]
MAGEGGGKAEAERSAREAKKKAAALREEVDRLTARAKDADSAVQKLAQKQDLVNQLRRTLKVRDATIKTFQDRAEDLAETKTLLSAELEAANQRLVASDRDSRSSGRSRPPPPPAAAAHTARELEDAKREAATLRQQVQHQSEVVNRLRGDMNRDREETAAAAGPTSEAVEAARAAAELAQDEADELRDRLAETERELQRMERRCASAMSTASRGGEGVADSFDVGSKDLLRLSGTGGLASRGDGEGRLTQDRLKKENDRLREENDRLSEELGAFDHEFFEEIEDLKYKYSEAVRKLRQFEQERIGG